MIGKTLAHYEVIAHLGSGGMGEVYRARDTKLGREVALKTLIPEMGDDPERIARFEREARSLATLQHPNVASIYGWEETDEARFLVMELVDGEELLDRIGRGAIPLQEAIKITLQITEGLSAAHEKGLVHRDLKPANIMLAGDGTTKILDFGLARAWAGDNEDEENPATSPTITAAMTMAGTILGTAAYMSPEQARGHNADRRADIWAVGVILYEMLTGQQLFLGETVSDTLAAVLTRDPDLDALPKDTPPNVRRALKRCLTRDPKLRIHDIADMRLELLSNDDEPTASVAMAKGGRARTGTLIAAAVAVILAAFVGVYFGRENAPPQPEPVLRMTVSGAGFSAWSSATISRDGKQIVWAQLANTNLEPLYIRSLDGFETRELAGTENGSNPAFSPDGKWVAYSNIATGTVYKVRTTGGPPQELCKTGEVFINLVWGEDGFIYLSGGGGGPKMRGILRVRDTGGEIESVTNAAVNSSQHWHPAVVPESDWLFFTEENDLGSAIKAVDLITQKVVPVVEVGSTPRFIEPNILLFYLNTTSDVMAVRIDMETMQPSGEPVVAVEQVSLTTMLRGCYEVSRNGHLIYRTGTDNRSMMAEREIMWVGPTMSSVNVFDKQSSWAQPKFSPDGDHLLIREIGTPNCLLWNFDLRRGTLSRVTIDVDAHDGIWNPVNGRIVFRYDGGGKFIIADRSPDGTGTVNPLVESTEFDMSPRSISKDGRWLIVDSDSDDGDIWQLDLENEGAITKLVSTRFTEKGASLSPDNLWLAYCSQESGRDEIYVVSWPALTHKQQISIDGGIDPVWGRDNQALYFSYSDKLMKVATDLDGEKLIAGIPSVFCEVQDFGQAIAVGAFDIAPDGERAVVAKSISGLEDQELRVVMGWRAELLEALGD